MQNIDKTKKTAGSGKKRKKMALGKGLGALIPAPAPLPSLPVDRSFPDDEYFLCDIENIRPNKYQPRRHFSEKELTGLSRSIEGQGIIQPLIIRKSIEGYELVAGERRLRAARMAGLEQIPVVVREMDDSGMLEMSIVENIQRENLNPIEESDAYHRLMTEFNLTQEQVGERVGKNRSSVANFLRLRQLNPEIRTTISDGTLSMGHAKALMSMNNSARQAEAWRLILAKGLSVREAEQLISRMKTKKQRPKPPRPTSEDHFFSDTADNLSRHFGTRVQIKRRGKKGKVEIEFYNDDDLDRLIKLLCAVKSMRQS